MVRTLKFYGASDDLFEIKGTSGAEPDEIGAYDQPRTVKVANDHGGLFVTALYAPNNTAACWMIGISQLDEDMPLPDWPMRWSSEGYSTVLEIDAPDSAVVEDTEPNE
jgi:hypothetical protein